ncbi:MAG: HRDC domain-containing protein, partial [Hyphomicrobiales bacterium]|nr:HRDC domain-containing protein [Hyphomicrobiales bacterium]
RAPAKKAAAKPPPSDLPEADQALLARLKALRLALAQAQDVPAYVIFSDRSLEDMARRRPRSREDFAEVHGVGAVTLERRGDMFLAAIAEEDEAA